MEQRQNDMESEGFEFVGIDVAEKIKESDTNINPNQNACENFNIGNSCLFCHHNPQRSLGNFNLFSGAISLIESGDDSSGYPKYVNVAEFPEQVKKFGTLLHQQLDDE